MAGDIRIETGFLDHPKTHLVQRRIGPDGPFAILRLWFFASESKPDGSFAGMSDEMIEIGAKWTGEPGKLVAALLEAGYLVGDAGDRELHEWAEHQPWVCERDARRAKAKRAANERWARRRGEDAAPHDATSIATSMPVACSEHARSNAPNPTQPNPTQHQPIKATPKAARAALALPVWLPAEQWSAFVEMRKRMKKPLTDRAIQLVIGKLEQFRASGMDPAAILDNSVVNGWQDVYAPKPPTNGAQRPRPPQSAQPSYLNDDSTDSLVETMRSRMGVSNA